MESRLDCNVFTSQFENLEINKNYDVILLAHSIQWLAGPLEHHIERAQALLKPNGVLVIIQQSKKGIPEFFPHFESIRGQSKGYLPIEKVAKKIEDMSIEYELKIIKDPCVDITNLRSKTGRELLSFMSSCDLRGLESQRYNELVDLLEKKATRVSGRLLLPEWLGILIIPNYSVVH